MWSTLTKWIGTKLTVKTQAILREKQRAGKAKIKSLYTVRNVPRKVNWGKGPNNRNYKLIKKIWVKNKNYTPSLTYTNFTLSNRKMVQQTPPQCLSPKGAKFKIRYRHKIKGWRKPKRKFNKRLERPPCSAQKARMIWSCGIGRKVASWALVLVSEV